MSYWKPIAALLLVVLLFGGGYAAGHHFASLDAAVKLSDLQAKDA
jgi:hypothetical protein